MRRRSGTLKADDFHERMEAREESGSGNGREA
jgi:hypothetical protein